MYCVYKIKNLFSPIYKLVLRPTIGSDFNIPSIHILCIFQLEELNLEPPTRDINTLS